MAQNMNAAWRQMLVNVAAAMQVMEVLDESNHPRVLGVRREIRTVRTLCRKILEHLERDLDQDYLIGIKRYLDGCELAILHKADPRTRHEYYVVTGEDLEIILNGALGDCALCTYDAKQAKRCKIRRALNRAGILADQEPGCPCQYQSSLAREGEEHGLHKG